MKTLLLRCFLLIFALSGAAFAQGRAGGGSRPSLGTLGTNSSNFPGSTGTNSPAQVPSGMFITGQVVLDDGTELTEPATIQTICRGQRRSQTYSNSHGYFSFQFGDSRSATAAISDASASGGPSQPGNQSLSEISGCQLQAELAGFSSQPVELSGQGIMTGSVDVGRVPLHRLAHVDGTSISVTSALAPAPAKKAFEKALEQEKKSKWDDAQKLLEKAVQIYPKYATAWYQLGWLQLRKQDSAAAKHSFEQSVAADPKYVNPYDGLAQLAMQAQDWHAVLDITNKLIPLNPVNFPDAYYDNAVANGYLGNFDDAEKSALQGIRVDDAHQIPKLQYVLAMILLQKQDYKSAAEHMQLYLSLAKQPNDVELAKKGLAQIEKSSASAQPPASSQDK